MSAEPPGFSVSSEREGGILVVAATGELDLAVAPELESALSEPAINGVNGVVVDLTELEFMDSSGLRTLLHCHERFGERTLPWAVAVADGSSVGRLLGLSEVEGQLPLCGSRAQAIESLGKPGR